jgi:hypothetical protein
MHKLTGIAGIFLLLLCATTGAYAVPRFSRQTGLGCSSCHSNPPELTAFGRDFKLRGYLLTEDVKDDAIENKHLWLSRYVPLSAMVQISNTTVQTKQPGTQNNTAEFPQQFSIFVAGKFAPHFGGLAQITYSHASDHFSMDNTDLRFANSGKLGGKDWDYGITLNNNPTVEDPWNSTPAWGFPWVSSDSAPSPSAIPVINGALAQDVAGLGAYSMWNHHLYTDVSVYRSDHAGASTPVSGTGQAFNVNGVAPYWRAAWQQRWGQNYLMLGTYGIYLQSFPGAVTGPSDRYVDPSVDFQYEHPFGKDLLDVHGAYTYEKSARNATFAAGGSMTPDIHLNGVKADTTFHWGNKYAATGAYFSTTGTADSLLYAPAALTGSNNGSPNSSGLTGQFSYWPWQNLDLSASYTGYLKFNGASTNYDGEGRNASDNNTLYITLWLVL